MHPARPIALAAALLAVACSNKTDKPTGAAPRASAEAPAPTGSGVIQGKVVLEGTAPQPEPWPGAGNADCKSLHDEKQQLVKVKDGAVEDVFVYVKEGLPKGSYPVPTTPVTFDQKGCEFSPRVFGVRAGQPIAMGNSDRLMHNVKSPEFNQGFPFGVKRTMTLNDPAVMSIIKCDVHPWMRSYAGVMEHPYFAVTKEDGSFSISGLVDGEYTVATWHERLGTQEEKVKVAGGAPAEVKFTYKAK